jgi:hypothetical protein
MEQTPKRRTIIRKKQVSKVPTEEQPLPPTTIPPVKFGQNCTFFPVIYDYTPKKCRCGGMYTSDSEYTPRECCGLKFMDYQYIPWDGSLPDYAYKKSEKEKFYSEFCKPIVYDFINDKNITSLVTNSENKIVTKVEETPRFSFMPASRLRETQRDIPRDSRETQRDSRETQRDSRETQRDSRETQRDSRETQRDSREYRTSQRDRDYHRSRDSDYEHSRRYKDEPNSHNGGRREPSKSKYGLDSELSRYSREF